MTAEQAALLDDALLRVMDSNRTRYGLGAKALAHLVKPYGFEVKEDVVLDRVDYLTRKLLTEEVLPGVHAANRAWRITEAGIRYLDERS